MGIHQPNALNGWWAASHRQTTPPSPALHHNHSVQPGPPVGKFLESPAGIPFLAWLATMAPNFNPPCSCSPHPSPLSANLEQEYLFSPGF